MDWHYVASHSTQWRDWPEDFSVIRRVYIDNYKCLVKFEYRPARVQLLMGRNGFGKSATFEVLEKLRDFVVYGNSTSVAFPIFECTAWQGIRYQQFEIEMDGLDVDGQPAIFQYGLTVFHNPAVEKAEISEELVRVNGKDVYTFNGRDVRIIPDDGADAIVYPADTSRSPLSSLPERPGTTSLNWIRWRLSRIYFFSIEPARLFARSENEQRQPSRDFSNFSSWYRRLVQERPDVIEPIRKSLARFIDGFQFLRFNAYGPSEKYLAAVFESPEQKGGQYSLLVDFLSPGQKCLLCMYTLLQFADSTDQTFCLDEPDNYIALRELHPWIAEMTDVVMRHDRSQCLFISHHPEFIDQFAMGHGVLFVKEKSGAIRAKEFVSAENGLKASEILARGWEG